MKGKKVWVSAECVLHASNETPAVCPVDVSYSKTAISHWSPQEVVVAGCLHTLGLVDEIRHHGINAMKHLVRW